ncbi:hypothetical protein HMF8227_02754 [Saliniradius amylolyticus]|uniref:SHS2 domain-containing protein n=2 Tax=Saliniradius amylolyticus TaxID=2183582 RepID=A0A2S2E6B2_9ALTE|nr:hypothetical protein HMF8227_02754 [Saliniradius amylolyticus]
MVGLDIGTRSVKGVLLTGKAEDVRLNACACEYIQGNAFKERDIDDYDAISTAIRKVQRQLSTKVKEAAIAVSGSSVITKVIHMDPGLSDFELESQIEVEADSLIPYPLDEVYVDFEELGESRFYQGKVDVLLSAAHRDMVDKRVTLLRELELEPKVVDVDGYALGTALLDFGPELADDEVLCCLNLGASQLLVTAVQNGKVIYSKEHNFGFDNLVRDIAMMTGAEPFEVQAQLVGEGMDPHWREQTWPMFLSNLQQQVNRALQMFSASASVAMPSSLLICGGGANLPGLAGELSEDLNMDVKVFNPLASLADKDDKQDTPLEGPQMTIALGLASRSFKPWHI